MNDVLINFKTSKLNKQLFEKISDSYGLSVSSMLNLFISKVIRTNSLPFNITDDLQDPTSKVQNIKKLNDFNTFIKKYYKETKNEDISIEEINKIIKEDRKSRAK